MHRRIPKSQESKASERHAATQYHSARYRIHCIRIQFEFVSPASPCRKMRSYGFAVQALISDPSDRFHNRISPSMDPLAIRLVPAFKAVESIQS